MTPSDITEIQYNINNTNITSNVHILRVNYPHIKFTGIPMKGDYNIIGKKVPAYTRREHTSYVKSLLQKCTSIKGKTKLKILVTALYVNGIASEGGSSFYMKCIIDQLRAFGHEVVATTTPEKVASHKFDLIICSHNTILNKIKHNPAYKICISQGIIKPEILHSGATKYYSVSEETKAHNKLLGIDSEVLGQPVNLHPIIAINDTLRNILIIRNNSTTTNPFKCLEKYYNVKYSNPSITIEEQIKWADLCITLGRGAVSAMSLGRPVLVADSRSYIGTVGDGYTNADTLTEIAKYNFSGRRYKYPITEEWLLSELNKYNPSDGKLVHKYVCDTHDIKNAVIRMLTAAGYEFPDE